MKRKNKSVAELLAEIEQADALYGTALEGLTKKAVKDAAALDASDIDARMAKADDDVAQMVADVFRQDLADYEATEKMLAQSALEEDALLAEREKGPPAE